VKSTRLFKGLVLFVAAGAFAAPAPKPAAPAAAPKPAPAHHSPLADRLARSEASVRALEHHLATAAEVRASQAANAKLAERAKKLARHHEHVPLLWTEYVRHVPGGIVVDNSAVAAFELEAEKSAAAFGNDLGALWARRKQVQAERMILWSKIAFRAVVDMELSDRPLYRFELKSAGKPLDVQRMAALNAAVQFVRVADHLAGQAQDAVDIDPQRVFEQWYKLLAAARSGMQDKLLLQALVALDVYKSDTEAGQLAAGAKQLAGLAQTIVDAERTMGAAEIAGDDEEADASRAQFQQALADTAGAVAALDHAVEKAATAWGVAAIPGTKVTVMDLPDLLGRAVASIPTVPAPAAPVGSPVERTEMVGNEHSADFTDDAPPGAILVGFEFTTEKVHKVHIVNAARAIYRGPAGEVTGKQLGHPAGAVARVVARPGYGVVSIEITTGAKHISGIVVHFMRIDGNVAVPTDAYDSSYGPKAGPGRKIGDKRPVVGIFGESGANVDKLGLMMRN
jgi:hypothetical protein